MMKESDCGRSRQHQPQKCMVVVCIDKEFAGADDFEMPEPTWAIKGNMACARDTAVSDELPLATLSSEHVYPGILATRYDLRSKVPTEMPTARHGIMTKLGRIAPGMGHSSRPHLGLYWPPMVPQNVVVAGYGHHRRARTFWLRARARSVSLRVNVRASAHCAHIWVKCRFGI